MIAPLARSLKHNEPASDTVLYTAEFSEGSEIQQGGQIHGTTMNDSESSSPAHGDSALPSIGGYMTRQELDLLRFKDSTGDKQTVKNRQLSGATRRPGHAEHAVAHDFLVEMNGVRVTYGNQVVLGDWELPVGGEITDGLYWSVRQGERWGIFGPNGNILAV